MSTRIVALFCVVAIAVAATTAQGAALLTGIPTTTAVATASSSGGTLPSLNGQPIHAIDGSGLTWDGGYTSATCDWNDWAQAWVSDGSAVNGHNQWLKIDLGASYVLDSLKFYNANGKWGGPPSYASRGINTGAIYLSNSATDPGNPLDNVANWTLAYTGSFDMATGLQTYTGSAQTFGIGGQTARYVSVLVDLTFQDPQTAPWDNNASIDEVVLRGTLVPEPSTLVLLAAGLISLIAYAWRKRK